MSTPAPGFIISVVGGKGGVGKSVFAANFALTLPIETRGSVLLIDLDSKSCGDQNIITGLKPLKTVRELTQFTGALNAQTLPTLLTKHSSGVYYLAAVRGPDEQLAGEPDGISRMLENLSRFFNYIVLDLGSELGPLQTTSLTLSTLCLVVTTPEILAINQTYRLLNELARASLPNEMIQIVLNKASPNGVSPQIVSQTLRRQVVAVIPQDDVTASASVQRSTPFVVGQNKNPITSSYHDLARSITSGGILQKLQNVQRPTAAQFKKAELTQAAEESAGIKGAVKPLDPRTVLKLRIHSELIKALDLKKGLTDTNGDPSKETALKQKTQQVISQLVDRESPNMARAERVQIVKEVLDEALALGPLEDLLADESVTEIMVNGRDTIFIEKSGKVQRSEVTFTSNLQLRNVIERIVTPLGRRIDEKTPYVDARLKDGSRVHAIIEPLSIDGPAVTIRKFAKKPITTKNYLEWGSMTQSMVDFLKICVENGLNVIVSGGTGSGKTTLLNVLSSFIPTTERIITVEDAAELQLKQTHVVRLETRPANMEGTGAVTIRDLVRNTLRMRPDRIIVGECRGGEALDMLSAMNTGHDGSMTTVHSNSPREAIGRLETLCMMAGMDLPAKAIREQIAGAVDLIIQISRLSDGSRKVISISEVVGMQGETVTQQEIFRFKEEGFDKNRKIIGSFQAMGLIPAFIEEFERRGVKIPRTLFTTNAAPSSPQSTPPVKKVSGGA